MNDDSSYIHHLVNKIFKRCNKSQNRTCLIEFIRNLKKIYFGIGKKEFERSLLPNLRDCILEGNTNILLELIKAIKVLPIKSLNVSTSLACYETIKNKGSLESILSYINPIIRIFILSELENQSINDSKSSTTTSLCSYLNIEGISKMDVHDYEPFLKPEVSKEIYNFFTSDVRVLANSKHNTIEFLFNLMMDDYKLNEEDSNRIKVSIY